MILVLENNRSRTHDCKRRVRDKIEELFDVDVDVEIDKDYNEDEEATRRTLEVIYIDKDERCDNDFISEALEDVEDAIFDTYRRR